MLSVRTVDLIGMCAVLLHVFPVAVMFAVLQGGDMFDVLPLHFLYLTMSCNTRSYSHQVNHDDQSHAFPMFGERPICSALVTRNSLVRICIAAQRSAQEAWYTQFFC